MPQAVNSLTVCASQLMLKTCNFKFQGLCNKYSFTLARGN